MPFLQLSFFEFSILMKTFLYCVAALSCFWVIGCGSKNEATVIEAPQMSEAERQKQMEEYDKQMNAGN